MWEWRLLQFMCLTSEFFISKRVISIATSDTMLKGLICHNFRAYLTYIKCNLNDSGVFYARNSAVDQSRQEANNNVIAGSPSFKRRLIRLLAPLWTAGRSRRTRGWKPWKIPSATSPTSSLIRRRRSLISQCKQSLIAWQVASTLVLGRSATGLCMFTTTWSTLWRTSLRPAVTMLRPWLWFKSGRMFDGGTQATVKLTDRIRLPRIWIRLNTTMYMSKYDDYIGVKTIEASRKSPFRSAVQNISHATFLDWNVLRLKVQGSDISGTFFGE